MQAPPLKILMVTPALPSERENASGTPTHIFKIRRGLRGAGNEVLTLAVDHSGRGHRGSSDFYCRWWEAGWAVRQVLARFDPDVIHCHTVQTAAFVLPFLGGRRVPVLTEVHGLFVSSRFGQGRSPIRVALSKMSGRLEPFVLRHSTHVLTQAQTMRDHIIRHMGVLREKIDILYPGLFVEEFSNYMGPAAQLEGVSPGDRVVMYIGSTARFQGLDLLAAAQREVLADTAHRLVLVLSNLSGSSDTLSKFGFLPDKTVILRPQSGASLPSIARRADVLVHARPDTMENMNVQSKLGLYLASGRPIVATAVGDYKTLLGEHKGSVLAEPTCQSVGGAIVRALNNASLNQVAAVYGPELARRHFDMNNNVNRLMQRFHAMKARSRGQK